MRFILAVFFVFFSCLPVKAEQEIPVWWDSVLNTQNMPVTRMFETLNKACVEITTKALTPIDASTFAFESIKSLSTIDEKISARKDGKRVLIFADTQILKSFPIPDKNDCATWSRLMVATAIESRPFSQKAKKADEDDFYNIFLNAALGLIDSYSHFVGADPVELTPLQNPASIGIGYRRIGRYLEITDIIPDSPAADSDLAVKDRISEINSKEIINLSRIEILNLLRGETDTKVFLKIRRNGKVEHKTLTRKPVIASPVQYYFDEADKIMTIKIDAFSEKTVSGLKSTLAQSKSQNAKGLIIDLRGNTGGLLKQAIISADLFLPPDLLVIKTKGRIKETENQYTSTQKDERYIFPIAILIDSKTASSAEFFAGVLQEYRHAVIVGTPSFGKGVIQAKEDLFNSGFLSLTWAKLYLPSGYTAQKAGIYPNICTSGKRLLDIDKPIKPFTNIHLYKTGNNSTIQQGLAACPRQSRKNQPFDDEVAKQLLLNPTAYENALSFFSLDLHEK